ncbi:MAG: bifunctional oligoribonuclease/PAP phosphatase NrnA [Flavobacteriales bacterium]|nr:bifunctional oligoribonuclease/PAP phosphatase NrnA [Flavobacteriales bacterium]
MSFPSAPSDRVAELAALLSAPRSLTIITHYNPDGDAMGSSLGLAHVLRAAGHRVQVVVPNTPAPFLNWLPGAEEVLVFDRSKEAGTAALKNAELVLCLDFNRQDRVGQAEEVLRNVPDKVLIDHHQDPEPFARVVFSDTSACATCQMVFDIVSALGLASKISVEAATCLYTGLVTDSGSFRFSSTKPHTMRVAADLMERGVLVERVHGAIMDDNTADRLRLLGFTLSERMQVLPELGVAMFHLSQADLRRFNFAPGDTEGFVNYGLSIRGIRLSAFFMERPDVVKVSLRSKGDLPVDLFCKEHFNGGGHRNAAGGQGNEGPEAAMRKFMEQLPAFLAQYPA